MFRKMRTGVKIKTGLFFVLGFVAFAIAQTGLENSAFTINATNKLTYAAWTNVDTTSLMGDLLAVEANTYVFNQMSLLYARRHDANSAALALHCLAYEMVEFEGGHEYIPVRPTSRLPAFLRTLTAVQGTDTVLRTIALADNVQQWGAYSLSNTATNASTVYNATSVTADSTLQSDALVSTGTATIPNVPSSNYDDFLLHPFSITTQLQINNYAFQSNTSHLAVRLLLGSVLARDHVPVNATNSSSITYQIGTATDPAVGHFSINGWALQSAFPHLCHLGTHIPCRLAL